MTPRLPNRVARVSGFSLVEPMIVVAIAIVLTILAVPAWQRHAERGWRMQARAELVSAMLALERHALVHLTFASAADGATPAGEWPKPVPPPPARTRFTGSPPPVAKASRCHAAWKSVPPRRGPIRFAGPWYCAATESGFICPRRTGMPCHG